MALATSTPLVETLLLHQIIEPALAGQIQHMACQFPDDRHLAGELIRQNLVTPYQVNQIFRGKVHELRIGRYLLLTRLGEGGMGRVFKAKQDNFGRIVALKVIHKRLMDNPQAVLRFTREIEASGRLSHPNIVQAFDADQVDDSYFFTMEYVEGVDLAKLVEERGPLLVPQACDYIRQAALGLQHAQSRGVVHRDIKPANLLVTRDGQTVYGGAEGLLFRPTDGPFPWGMTKILDMGLARWKPTQRFDERTVITKLGSIMGTPDYIAPEQARNARSSDIRSDLYSLGCTMYFLLAGQPPFPEGSVTEKLMCHQLDAPKPVQKVRYRTLNRCARAKNRCARAKGKSRAIAIVPTKVVEIMNKLMAKDPNDRFQTPAELADALAVFAPPSEKKPSRHVASPALA